MKKKVKKKGLQLGHYSGRVLIKALVLTGQKSSKLFIMMTVAFLQAVCLGSH